MTTFTLHYAPDNASLIVRLVLEELGCDYDAVLVDRRANAQSSDEFRKLNPVGRIPALETPHGTMFETAAIILWLADTHEDLAPAPDDPARARFLSLLFFMSNTVHAEMRCLFYPDTMVGKNPGAIHALSSQVQRNLSGHFDILNTEASEGLVLGREDPWITDIYAAVLMRWPRLYPLNGQRDWFDLQRWPALKRVAETIEARPSATLAKIAEGLGTLPFSKPEYPDPPEGSAL